MNVLTTIINVFAMFEMLATGVSSETSQIWASHEELANVLPASLAPTYTFPAQATGECFTYCLMKNCSSVAYSDVGKSCKLYNHNDQAKPLPKLAQDTTGFQHQMYYKKKFCPAGWEADYATGKCYFMDTSSAKQRPAAWQVCEERLMSELVTFQTPLQRDNLYQILTSKYSGVQKWWSGYALFDSNLWPRPIDEIPDYRSYRGDCGGNDLIQYFDNPANCANKCDRVHRDKCVGFVYEGPVSKCWLKYKMCDLNSNTSPLGGELWTYHKIHAGRPMTTNVNLDAGGYDVKLYPGTATVAQCKAKLRNHLDGAHAVLYANGDCWIHRRGTYAKGTCGGCTSWDVKDFNEGWCPYGVRYRDVCLLAMRTPGQYSAMESWCRTMGGKFTRPVDGKRKASYFYGISGIGQVYVDYVGDTSTGSSVTANWTTKYDGLTLNNSVYDKWTGNPSGDGYCASACGRITDSTGTYSLLNDLSCASNCVAICELPITQPYPKTCRFTPMGREYMGQLTTTTSGVTCKYWNMTAYSATWRQFSDWYTSHSYCRNPDDAINAQPWCYRSDNGNVEACNVPLCPESDWAPSQTYDLPESPYAAITKTATQTDNYYWTVEGISSTANALCQINMAEWCPFYFRGSCYQFYQIPYNHNEAQAICAQNGWHLASITSLDEQKFILGLTQRLAHQWWLQITGYHIGLYWNTAANNWAWENGELYNSVANLWQGGAAGSTGAGICASVQSSNQGWWTTVQCYLKDWFLCEIELAG